MGRSIIPSVLDARCEVTQEGMIRKEGATGRPLYTQRKLFSACDIEKDG